MANVPAAGGGAAPRRKPKPQPTPKPRGVTRGGDPRKARAAEEAAKKRKRSSLPTRGGRPQPKPKPKAPLGYADDRRQSTMAQYPVSPRSGGLDVAAILDTGMGWIGVPYKWGGTDPRYGLDCSGLIQAMFAEHGVKLPRVSYQQAKAGKAVRPQDARPGDIIAMDWNPKRPGIDHVGVYLGNGKMLVAPRSGKTVEVQAIDFRRVATIRRVLPEEAFQSIKQGNKYVYKQGAAARANDVAGPRTAGPEAGGGDPGNNPRAQNVRPQDVVTQQDVVTTKSVLGSGGDKPIGRGTGPGGKVTADDFGFAASFFNSDPELKKLLHRALTGDGTGFPWEPEKFQVEFQKTKWYRTHSASAREWIALNHNDPAAARRKVEIRAAEIHKLALEMGADITGLEAHDLAVLWLSEGWSDSELQKRLGSHVEFKRGEPWRGEAGVNYVTLKQKAAAFGVKLNDDQLARWVRDFAMQVKTEQDFDNFVKAQAKLQYPGLAREIDAGLTPQDVAGLYVNMMAEVWEVDPVSIDWSNDPMIRRALSYVAPGATGGSPFKGSGPDAQRKQEKQPEPGNPMPLWQFEQELKKDPRWLKTNQAANDMMHVAGQVLRDWGLMF